MIKLKGKTYRNTQEQVCENANDIAEIKEELANLGPTDQEIIDLKRRVTILEDKTLAIEEYLDDLTISTSMIQESAVTTSKINDKAVTKSKLSTDLQNKIDKKYYEYGVTFSDDDDELYTIQFSFTTSNDALGEGEITFQTLCTLIVSYGLIYRTLNYTAIQGYFYDLDDNYGGSKSVIISSNGEQISVNYVQGLSLPITSGSVIRITYKRVI